MFIVNLFISYPLVIYPSNIIIEHYLYDKMARTEKIKWLKNLNRAWIVAFTLMMGLYFEESLDRLMSVVGSLFLTPIAFILPAIFHLVLVADTLFAKVVDWALMLIGIALMIVITSYTLYNWN